MEKRVNLILSQAKQISIYFCTGVEYLNCTISIINRSFWNLKSTISVSGALTRINPTAREWVVTQMDNTMKAFSTWHLKVKEKLIFRLLHAEAVVLNRWGLDQLLGRGYLLLSRLNMCEGCVIVVFGIPKPVLLYFLGCKIVFYSVLWVANYQTLRTTALR